MQLKAHLRLCQSCLSCYKGGLRLFAQSSARCRTTVNYYELLGVKQNATLDEIKNAFFDKSKKLHPDSDPFNPSLHNQFVVLNEAHRVLSKESNRKEYDLKFRAPNSGQQGFRSPYSHSSYRASQAAQDSEQYWQQFRPSQDMTVEDWQKRRRRRNSRLVVYCMVIMAVSVGVHVAFFRILEEVHSSYMDGKDKVIREIYIESKERARINGFKKQTQILRQRHAEFLKRYKIKNGEDK